MFEHLLVGLSSLIVLGILAQWLAWRLHLPSILLLLLFGFIAGPLTGFLKPDLLLGDLLVPAVSMSVALILFEGGLSLRIAELRETGGVVRNLVTVGLLATWSIAALAAHFVLDLGAGLAVLLGAIVVVTGPTVIGPLLRHVRPVARVSSTLKWEGIVIDPIGAMLAVLVFEAILAGGAQEAATRALFGVLKTVLVGGAIGAFGAGVMINMLKRYWIPDFLHSPVSLMVVVIVFAISNVLQPESGLLAAALMGVVLANQKAVAVKHIIEFKENLRVLLISTLFILLAARLQVSDVSSVGLGSLAFLGVLMLIARPIAVTLSSLGSGLSWKERLFISWIAPRGIVAAAVSSVFALRLEGEGELQAELLVPYTFMVIVGTVGLNGITAAPIARMLGVAQPNPQGFLIVSAHSWARQIASALKAQGFQTLLVDSNWQNITAARKEGFEAYYGSIVSEYILDDIKLDGIGRMLLLTSNDDVNSLAALHFAEVFGRANVYQLPPQSKETVPKHLRGRLLFGTDITFLHLTKRFAEGSVMKATKITQQFDFGSFQAQYRGSALPLFLVGEEGGLTVFTADERPTPKAGQTLMSIVDTQSG